VVEEVVMTTVTVRAAKTQRSRLIAHAERGEQVIVARGKRPVPRLFSIENARPRRQVGAMRGNVRIGPEFFEPLPEDELTAWEGG
jgi:antitoxin (DNA-binding transcriptional repressor) of toxin-antitoxin stability system